MIPVADAQALLFDLVDPLGAEEVDLRDAPGRILARDIRASRDQPPFRSAAMDGYAVKSVEAERDAQFKVIGESAAGRRFDGVLGAGQAVRIFTGAPVPDGADTVIIQEDVHRSGDLLTLRETSDNANIRPHGTDFTSDFTLRAPRRLGPNDVALLAAMNVAQVPVARRPTVALISTGDELVFPGTDPGPDQIVASNTFGLAAMLTAAGAAPRILPIARDSTASLETAFDLARGADLVVTIGGASVGDYDLVGTVAAARGLDRSFYKVRMRPGKPLMAGRLAGAALVGLPGNPVSAMVCGHVFIKPMIDKMLGLGAAAPVPQHAPLAADVAGNGPREHYMRAHLGGDGLTVFDRQDSSLLSVLADANALVIRPPNDPAQPAGTVLPYLPI